MSFKSHLRATVAGVVAVSAAVFLGGCDSGTGSSRAAVESNSAGASLDQATIQDALQFGALVLPSQGQVLGVRHDSGIDERYTLAIATPAQTVNQLLAASKFTTPLTSGVGVGDKPIDGYDPGNSANTASGSDVLRRGDHTNPVNREVLVDRNNSTVIVHWWLFTT